MGAVLMGGCAEQRPARRLHVARGHAVLTPVRRSRRPRLTRFPAWLRLFCAFAILLVAGEHTLASLHQALTPHELCEEHGELVHAEHEPADVAHGESSALDAGPQAEAEHHHCGIVPAAPTRAPAATPGSDCAVASATLVQVRGPSERAVVSIDVLAFAPKLSPPA